MSDAETWKQSEDGPITCKQRLQNAERTDHNCYPDACNTHVILAD